ncbi:MAG: protein-export membrane protein SecF [Gammaproteobacteria bacterium RIFOXYB2_FULL_38_6]|nr:MAG: protein-export membrane protein SecF [Gammaproteobacteria bacterium RIFOXYB2_FULL_38_6]
MEFFKANTKIRFMKQRMIAAVISLTLCIGSIVVLMINGLNLGLDFTGGTQIEMQFNQAVQVDQIRENLVRAGFPQVIVQAYTTTDISIQVGPHKDLTQEELKAKVTQAVPNGNIVQINYIGPQIGKTLMTNGILAIVVAMLGTMIYIALRFEYRFALSATISLIHDPLLILGIFALFHLQFDLIVLAGVLTVIGYSLNDTVVVYDRVRENFRKVRRGTPLEIMDLSINQTLSRTIMTSGLTMLVVVALFIFGGEVVHNFALALMIGIVVGTYSSIYVAGSLALMFGLTKSSLVPAKKMTDELP